MSRLQSREPTVELQRPSTRASTRPTEKTQAKSEQATAQASRTRLTSQEFANNLKHYQRRHSSRQQHLSQPKEIEALVAGPGQSAGPPGSTTAISASTSPDRQQPGNAHQLQPPRSEEALAPVNRPSDTQVARDVELFRYYRTHQVVRNVFEQWCGSAFQVKGKREGMAQKATKHDISTLLRSGFDQWRNRLRRKRRSAEIKRFFSYQERKVGKDRDLHLLRKAFTHWAECCRETRRQNHQDRRHFLAIKYFTAWLHLTTVNSQKISRQQLAKAFKIWRQRVAQTSAFSVRATLLHNHRIARSAYWCWFWTFCEARAPVWKGSRTKKGFFLLWATKQQQLSQREQRTERSQKASIGGKHLMVWLHRYRGSIANAGAASDFRRKNVLTQAIQLWRRNASHAPLVSQVSNMVDWRVAGTIFATIVSRYRTERQADLVSHSRLMRNSWTAWNDQLRQQTLVMQIDDRVVIEALYRWVIQERYILLARLHQQRIVRRALSMLTLCWSGRKAQRNGAQRTVETTIVRSRLVSIWEHWHARLESSKRNKRIAFEFHSPKVTQEITKTWMARRVYLQKLHDWAKDAEFYLLATKLIKQRWHDAMIESKRQKRRNAYAQMRRAVKMHLAARVLQRWRHKTALNGDQMEEACLRYQDRLLYLGTGFFDTWRIQTDARVTQSEEADFHYRVNLGLRYLSIWSDQTTKQWRMADIADLNDNMRIHDIGKHWLRKLRLRMIRVTGGPEALAWFVNANERRRLQNLFRLWQGKTTGIVPRPPPGSNLSSRIRKVDLSHTAQYPERAAFDRVFDLGESVSGFPNTPSKAKARAERAIALVEASTTPAGTPFQPVGTPFPLRRRPQRVTETASVRRSALAKSTVFRDSVFPSIREASPSTPSRG